MLLFGGCYLVMAVAYHLYLEYGGSQTFYPDFFTNIVSKQTRDLLEALGYHSAIAPHPNEASMKLYLNGHYLVRIVEGCNAVSVIILFISFIVAFHAGLKKTLLFILAGSAIIYVLNIVRIAILTIGIYKHPEYEKLLHGTVFPAIIYGTLFLLWVVWVRYVTKRNKKKA